MAIETGYDAELKKFTARNAGVFPLEAYQYADQLEILDISGELSALPDDMKRFTRLRVAFLSNSGFTEVPPQLATCDTLQMLGMKSCKIARWDANALPETIRGITLTDNQLTTIPAAIGHLVSLQKLMLAGNKLTDLPREILTCTKLDNIRISANQFTTEPHWLRDLPSLAWYSDAGNPFCRISSHDPAALPVISWNDLELQEKLGESAKNSVYRARLRGNQDVAIKVYGGHLTTDGYVDDEIRASIAAGPHPNLISATAIVADTPDQKPAVILPLISPACSQLAMPPDLITLTRDIFSLEQRYSAPFVKKVLGGIASALAHLHGNSVMHGDMYAHNILTDQQGMSYLGDFGGASIYNPDSGGWREGIDVCAFGNLMDELLSRCDDPGIDALYILQQACVQPVSVQRPVFRDILQSLQL